MAITLQLNPEVEARLLRDAEAKGLAVSAYVEKLVERQSGAELSSKKSSDQLRERLMILAGKWHDLPTLDSRSSDELTGYDEIGLPS